ncbi:MAG: biopolymer transporter ExbD [Verrucomicrobiota bacterium]
MIRRRQRPHEAVEMQMGPMIDMVFLLLVFFMVTSKPVKPEADLTLALPGALSAEAAVDLPENQTIQIQADGSLVVNELAMSLSELTSFLVRFKKSADNNLMEALVTVQPEDEAAHQRIVDVLDACATAGIEGVTFTDAPKGTGGIL